MMKQSLRIMRRAGRLLRRYRQLSAPHRGALWEAAGWIVVMRLALEVFAFRRVFRYVEDRAETLLDRGEYVPPTTPTGRAAVRRTVWAVRATGHRLLPKRPCLTQALVGRMLLAQHGVAATLHIGVTKADDELKAHAWLERDDAVILGGTQSREDYRPFPALSQMTSSP